MLMLIAAGLLSASGCDETNHFVPSSPAVVTGNGVVVEQQRPIGPFTKVDLRGVGILYIRQGAATELYIRAEENLLEYLKTEVRAGELQIRKDADTLLNLHPIEYHLTVTDIRRVALTGAGGVRGLHLDTDLLTVLRTGVGSIEFVDLNATELEIEIFGLGEVILSGAVQRQTVRLRSMSSYDGRDLESAEAELSIGSIGSATVRVRDRLDATIDGSGSVFYIGDPLVTSHIRGSGEVVQIGG
jgi:hypothetical protein